MSKKRTKMRDVSGMLFLADKWTTQTVTVRVTKDERGKTLSLNVGQIMILVPIEPVEDLIDIPDDELTELRQLRQLDMAEIVRLRREIQELMEKEEERKWRLLNRARSAGEKDGSPSTNSKG